jgi:hypothetical protein
VTDEFLWVLERWVIGRYLDLCENGHHIARTARFPQSVLERLLQHVADPAGGTGDENAKRKRRDFAPRLFVANELVSDLRSVPVDDHDAPSVESKIHDRSETRSAVAELIADC